MDNFNYPHSDGLSVCSDGKKEVQFLGICDCAVGELGMGATRKQITLALIITPGTRMRCDCC